MVVRRLTESSESQLAVDYMLALSLSVAHFKVVDTFNNLKYWVY